MYLIANMYEIIRASRVSVQSKKILFYVISSWCTIWTHLENMNNSTNSNNSVEQTYGNNLHT